MFYLSYSNKLNKKPISYFWGNYFARRLQIKESSPKETELLQQSKKRTQSNLERTQDVFLPKMQKSNPADNMAELSGNTLEEDARGAAFTEGPGSASLTHNQLGKRSRAVSVANASASTAEELVKGVFDGGSSIRPK